MQFDKEADFEEAVIKALVEYGWESTVLRHPTEEDLLKNWAEILFNNNRQRDRLNNVPLTDSEMQQILEQITLLRTPLRLNDFINGKSVAIKRDNPDDPEHFGKEVSLKIYDRQEIALGESRYQIAQQPHFKTKNPILNTRRGDLMLLINGMPIIHIELKRSDVPVSEAYNQIEKYSHEGVFRGIFRWFKSLWPWNQRKRYILQIQERMESSIKNFISTGRILIISRSMTGTE